MSAGSAALECFYESSCAQQDATACSLADTEPRAASLSLSRYHPPLPALLSIYQIPGTIANLFALYFPPNSFLYLRSFFFAQTAI